MAKPSELITRAIFVHTDLYIHAHSQSMHIRQNIRPQFPAALTVSGGEVHLFLKKCLLNEEA